MFRGAKWLMLQRGTVRGNRTAGCFGSRRDRYPHGPRASAAGSLRLGSLRIVFTQPEPKPQRRERKKGPNRIEQGIVRRGGAADDEGLMDLIENGVTRGYGERGNAPGPLPAFAIAAHAAIDQHAKNEVLREVRAFPNNMVNVIELISGEVRKQPMNDRRK